MDANLPLGLGASAAVAALPILAVFGLMGALRLPGHKAGVAGTAVAGLLAVAVWRFPPVATVAAGVYGMATGLFPIIYIVAGSLLLYNLTVTSGWAERLRAGLSHTVPDHHLLLLLIGFGFAAFLDSTAGFLTPVTVAVALLAGLGVPALDAAAYTLVATALPPIFGAMAIPVVVLAEATQLEVGPLAATQALGAAVLFAFFPLWLTATFGGRAALRRLWAHAVAAGFAYALALWWVATRISPYPAAVAASIAALAATVLVEWRRRDRALGDGALPPLKQLQPWWPYLVLMAMVTVWSLPAASRWLSQFSVYVPIAAGPVAAKWRLDLLASPGTAIILAALLFGTLARLSGRQWQEATGTTARQLRFPLLNMMAMFALAQIMNFSGMTAALGAAVAGTGHLFPVISPFLSWLGAAISGSNTASNAMLGKLQATTAAQLGLDPLVIAGLAGLAAPLGKAVAPQVISAAVGAGNLSGTEGRLLRSGLFHSLVWTAFIALLGGIVNDCFPAARTHPIGGTGL